MLLIASTSLDAKGLLRNAAIDRQRARSFTTDMLGVNEDSSDFNCMELKLGEVLLRITVVLIFFLLRTSEMTTPFFMEKE